MEGRGRGSDVEPRSGIRAVAPLKAGKGGAMPTHLNMCRSCHQRRGLRMEVECTYGSQKQLWVVEICRDCWRAWEALLDQAMVGKQPDFEQTERGRLRWFA